MGEPRRLLICPSGKSVAGVSSPVCKNISLNPSGKSLLELRASRPREGRWPSSRTLGGMRWTFLRQKTNSAKADGEVVWAMFWHLVKLGGQRLHLFYRGFLN